MSVLTVLNDRLNDKGNNVNSLLKRKCDEEKTCFVVDNTNINIGMFNNSDLHLNEQRTTRFVNNFCMDTVVTKKDGFNNPTNVTKILKQWQAFS